MRNRLELCVSKHVWTFGILLCGVTAFAGIPQATAQSGLFSLERMGAGIPAGWRVQGENYTWEGGTRTGAAGARRGGVSVFRARGPWNWIPRPAS